MEAFIEVSVLLGVVVALGIAMRVLRQPIIIAYILAGILAGPYVFDLIRSADNLELFSRIGVAVLLFIVGLHLSPRVIREVGKISVLTGVGQVLFTAIAGFFIVRALGFATLPALYVSVALTFSSTIIILKLLSDKGDLNKLYGKIAVGFLLVQDLIATILLVLIAVFAARTEGEALGAALGILVFKGLLMAGAIVAVSRFIIPPLARFFAASQELLFLFAISWGLGFASLFYLAGFSVEIGALIAGITLSTTPFAYEIGARLKPLRDFFIVIFFVLLGSQMVLANLAPLVIPAVVLSLFILIGNPLIVMLLMGGAGYGRQNAFRAGLTVAQISEFSLILVALGVSVGHVPGEILSLVTLVGLITIAGSTYLILYADRIYPSLKPLLFFIPARTKKHARETSQEYEVLLFGYDRMGGEFVHTLKKLGAPFCVVDYNPKSVARLEQEKLPFRYGDAEDLEFLEELALQRVKMCISTIPDTVTNLLLTKYVREKNTHAIVLAIAHSAPEAQMLYEAGATYVIMPHYLGAHYAAEMIGRHGINARAFEHERAQHLARIRKIPPPLSPTLPRPL